MTAPRIIPAAEAQAMLEAGRLEQGPRLDLLLSAPDLAASVVALHALLDEAYDIIVSQRNPAWDDWCDRACRIDLKVAP